MYACTYVRTYVRIYGPMYGSMYVHKVIWDISHQLPELINLFSILAATFPSPLIVPYPPWQYDYTWYPAFFLHTLPGTNISHLGNRKIIFKSTLKRGYVSFQEGKLPDLPLKPEVPTKIPKGRHRKTPQPPKCHYEFVSMKAQSDRYGRAC